MATETALVTGASSGIGLELAQMFAADGSDLILVARSEARLEALAAELRDGYGVEVTAMAADLSDPAAPDTLARRINEAGLTVDVVVNNAGFGLNGAVAELDEAEQAAMVQVNVMALTRLTRMFLPGMIARGRGGVLNVGSTAGFQSGPYMTVYYATKAYVMSFTEGLGEELSGTGVTATLLAPGPTETGFQRAAAMDDALLFKMGTASAHAVARAGYEGFRSGRLFVVPGLRNKMGALSVRAVPRAVVRKAVTALQK